MEHENARNTAADPFADSLARNVEDTTEALVEAAGMGAPGALAAVLIDAVERLGVSQRVTLWRRARARTRSQAARPQAGGAPGDGPSMETGNASSASIGSGAWMKLRSRGETTPTPDTLHTDHFGTSRFGVLHGSTIGTLVYECAPFDDGRREAREDALEALFLCADTLAGSAPELDETPSALPSPRGSSGHGGPQGETQRDQGPA